MSDKITFTLDGREVSAEPGETIWQVAKREGTKIPHLCHKDAEGYRPGRQLPRLHGGGGRRAHACGLLHPRPARPAWWCTPPPSGPRNPARW